jgi:hypothetical protein
MKTVKSALMAASVGAFLAVLGTAPAAASPITFTWNPAATTGGTLSSPLPLAPQFTANNLNIADYAMITLGAPNGSGGFNNVTESAILAVTSLSLKSPSLSAPGFTPGQGSGALTAQAGATPYELYFVVTSTSQLSPDGLGGLAGQFTTLTYQLMGDVGGNCTFSATAGGPSASCGLDTQLTLATGSLNNSVGSNSASINSQNVPSANVAANIVAGANAGGFFVSPSDLTLIDFSSAFINTSDVTTVVGPGQIVINGGGGNVNITVPEPLTLSLFGAGLLGAGAMRRRRSKKA